MSRTGIDGPILRDVVVNAFTHAITPITFNTPEVATIGKVLHEPETVTLMGKVANLHKLCGR
jgi:hypothetical protein